MSAIRTPLDKALEDADKILTAQGYRRTDRNYASKQYIQHEYPNYGPLFGNFFSNYYKETADGNMSMVGFFSAQSSRVSDALVVGINATLLSVVSNERLAAKPPVVGLQEFLDKRGEVLELGLTTNRPTIAVEVFDAQSVPVAPSARQSNQSLLKRIGKGLTGWFQPK